MKTFTLTEFRRFGQKSDEFEAKLNGVRIYGKGRFCQGDTGGTIRGRLWTGPNEYVCKEVVVFISENKVIIEISTE